jgi:hypothetical protein
LLVLENTLLVLENRLLVLENRLLVLENRLLVLENRLLVLGNRELVLENRLLVLENRLLVLENRLLVRELHVFSYFLLLSLLLEGFVHAVSVGEGQRGRPYCYSEKIGGRFHVAISFKDIGGKGMREGFGGWMQNGISWTDSGHAGF